MELFDYIPLLLPLLGFLDSLLGAVGLADDKKVNKPNNAFDEGLGRNLQSITSRELKDPYNSSSFLNAQALIGDRTSRSRTAARNLIDSRLAATTGLRGGAAARAAINRDLSSQQIGSDQLRLFLQDLLQRRIQNALGVISAKNNFFLGRSSIINQREAANNANAFGPLGQIASAATNFTGFLQDTGAIPR